MDLKKEEEKVKLEKKKDIYDYINQAIEIQEK